MKILNLAAIFLFLTSCGVRLKEEIPLKTSNNNQAPPQGIEAIAIIPNSIYIQSVINKPVTMSVYLQNKTTQVLSGIITSLLNNYPEISITNNECLTAVLAPQASCRIDFILNASNITNRSTLLTATSGTFSSQADFVYNTLPDIDSLLINNAFQFINEGTVLADELANYLISGESSSYSIITQPQHGTLTVNSATGVISYSPVANFSGLDSFTFKAQNELEQSNISTYQIFVQDVATPPSAFDLAMFVNKNTPKPIVLVGQDDDSRPLTYTIINAPQHGSLTGVGANKTYTPASNYLGVDSFSYKVNNGSFNSNIATVSIVVSVNNTAPIASNSNINVNHNSPANFTLVATDADGDTLSYIIVSQTAHGTISGSGTTLVFTPNSGFAGSDTLTFKANDGTDNSNTATISFSVSTSPSGGGGPNIAPIAQSKSVATTEDSPLSILLVATDANNDSLTYTIISQPAHGTVSGAGQSLIYTPNLNYNGVDSFTFKANDGLLDSNIATVSINVSGSNDAPTATSQTVAVTEDTPKSITLQAADVEGDPLTYILLTAPLHGTISGTGAYLTYTPAANYYGEDSFSFKVNDGIIDSNVATASLNISAVSDAPIASALSFSTNEDTDYNGTLAGSDADGNTLTYSIFGTPTHGTVTIINLQNGEFIYTPTSNYAGPDSFSFKVHDGVLESNIAIVSATVSPVNNAPVALNQSFSVNKNTDYSGTASGSDIDSSSLTYSMGTPVSHGILQFNPNGSFSYVPDPSYVGSDSFTFTISDGLLNSNTATVSINVIHQNTAPQAQNLNMVEYSDQGPISGQVEGTDSDGDSLSYNLVTSIPGLTFNPNGSFSYVKPSSELGDFLSFTFTASDGQLFSNTALVQIQLKLRDNQLKIATNPSLVPHSLSEYPLVVDLQTIANLNHFWENVQANGGDIIVTLEDKVTKLPLDLRNFNKIERTGQLWFKSSIVSNTENTFYIQYNNDLSTPIVPADKNSTYGGYKVWINNYVGVWDMHLNTSGIEDATLFQHHLTKVETPIPLKSGYSDQGVKLNIKSCDDKKDPNYEGDCVGDKDYFTRVSNPNLQLSQEITISAWVYPTQKHSDATIIRKESKNKANYELKLNKLKPSFIFEYKDSNKALKQDREVPLNQWTFIVGSYNKITKKSSLYINGVLVKEEVITPNEIYAGYTTNLEVGNKKFRGYLDEIKLSTKALSPEWIKTEYNMLNQANTFWLVDDEQIVFSDSFNKPGANAVENSWTEYEGCSQSPNLTSLMQGSLGLFPASTTNSGCGYIKAANDQLEFYNLTNAIGFPEAKQTIAPISTGKLYLSFNIDFKSTTSKGEAAPAYDKDGKKLDPDFAVFMNFGENTKNIGELVWGTRYAGLPANKGFGVVNKATHTISQIKRVNHRDLVIVSIDYETKTFSVFLRSYRVLNIPFTDATSVLNKLSIIVNDTHSGYVPRILIDNVVIKKK